MNRDTEKLGFQAFVARMAADMKLEVLILFSVFKGMEGKDELDVAVNKMIVATILADELARHFNHLLSRWSTETNKGDLLKLAQQMHRKEVSQLFEPVIISIYTDVFVGEFKISGPERFNAVNSTIRLGTLIDTPEPDSANLILAHQLLLADLPIQLDAYREILAGWSKDMGQPYQYHA